jgi:hypothetical protein
MGFTEEQLANRYQNQPRHIKIYRWLKYKPYSYVRGVYLIVWWVLRGCVPDSFELEEGKTFTFTRLQTMNTLWRVGTSIATTGMEHWYTYEEVFENLRRHTEDK